MNLEINHIAKDGEDYLLLNGEIDIYTSDKLKYSLLPLTEKKGNKVTVDFSNVNYIDSTGLGIFIGALKATHKYESSIKLVGMIERVRRLFNITGLDEVINIEESAREEAK
ncbi:anti-sigma factor antagonist [Anaerobacillus alkaliphilus]|uniref:Anti-sigma factor antagonist n=1 Tax=Anaerobacillus alkaliphilus TaxID=1548597 RepID=A0A4Q0VUP4_9BACI|nr:STAS domain-containing protein [Anaerobacillus alkaliphilus]RXJ01955.1 anti-sigma factor antagonist [Anaerobacillus alkaliphilus]